MNDEKEDKGLFSNIKEYASVTKELAMLTVAEKTSTAAAGAAAGGVLAILGLFAFLFANLTLGFYLSEVIGNSWAGFLILTGFYLLLAIIIYLTQEKMIKKPIENGMIKKFFKERNEAIYENPNR
jgi:protein-S-isoprenylcysteine O-methyltransferase Ste14